MEISFGIHVGNSSVCLAVSRDGKTDVVANAAGDRVTPAVVAYNDSEIVVGLAAKQSIIRNPANTIVNNKLFWEGNVSEPVVSQSAVAVQGDQDGNHLYEVTYKDKQVSVSPQEILRHILAFVHDIAQSHTTSDVNERTTVMTVPHAYSPEQRRRVSECAQEAGFNVQQVVSEPSAACLAYGLGQDDPSDRFHVLVYRVGGVSMTVSLILVSGGCYSLVDSVTAPVGGTAVTKVLVDFLAKEFLQKHKMDISESKRGRAKLTGQAEVCKHVLSTLDTAHCFVESLYDGMDFSTNVTRARFDNELSKVMTDLMSPISVLLDRCRLKHSDVAKVLLCGGSTKVTRVQKQLTSLFPDAELLSSLSPDEVIALGAAAQAAAIPAQGLPPQVSMLSLSRPVVLYSPGLPGGMLTLVAQDTPLPVKRSQAVDVSPQTEELSAKVCWHTEDLVLGTVSLKLDDKSKVYVTSHIHRDGSSHFTLTDRTSGHSSDCLVKPDS